MPLPQKVIEQLGREPPKTPGWSGQLLMFSSTVFFLSLFIYLGLTFGYEAYLNSGLKKVEDEKQRLAQDVPAEEQSKIVNFYSQIANLQSLLANHVYLSPLFDWLEKNTQTNVYLNKFNLNITSNQLALGGVAKTMEDVNQQLAIFQSRPEIQRMSVTNITMTLNLWQFDLSLYFEPGYFYRLGAAPQ